VFNLDMKLIIKIVRCLWLVFSIFIVTVVSAQVSTQNGSAARYRATERSSDSPLNFGDMSISDLQATFEKGTLTAETVVRRYLARIEAYDKAGPMINSTISLNHRALAEARALDAERKAGRVRGPLHGIPFSLKDNINTKDLPTTAGSCLLTGSTPSADAFVVKKLRDAGAILLSKDNLSEFASGGGSVAGASDPDILRAGRTGSSKMGMASPTLITPYSGLPELVVPAGLTTDGLPITISFIGQAYREAKLLGYGYDFEQATHARVLPRNTPPLDIETIVK
jgi:Asp-tRNA(Asn)/Glu-tRNA(Gln) amidotransferase A subunit family amidase